MTVRSKQVLVFVGIGFAMSLIFGSGVWVGRVTAPEGLTYEEMEEYYEVEKERARNTGKGGPSLNGLPRLEALKRYDRTLRLKPEQRRTLYPLFAEASRKVRALPEKSKGRLQVIEELHVLMREHLDENQKGLANEILEKARRKEWE